MTDAPASISKYVWFADTSDDLSEVFLWLVFHRRHLLAHVLPACLKAKKDCALPRWKVALGSEKSAKIIALKNLTIAKGMTMSEPPESGLRRSREIYDWACQLYPICRSLTGEGNRQTLRFLQKLLPSLKLFEVPSGTKAFDWEVPPEWNIRQGWIKDEAGKTIVDFADHNLHVMGYSEPVDRQMSFEELDRHLYSLPHDPDAIPYVTSYYKRRWGFCLRHHDRERLDQTQKYRVYIDSSLTPGALSYGELILEGETSKEVLLSTYICHPSMANNELSGPVVATALGRWLMGLKERRYTYRILFLPETIGSIVYLSRHLEELKERVIAGFVLTCVGDDRGYSYIPSRQGDTLADRAALHVLNHHTPGFERYTFLDRGSDERQYCSIGVDLPVALMMRTKFNEFPEYHTSKDDLSLISPAGLGGAFALYQHAIQALEQNYYYRTTVCCEPQLGKRGLYPTVSTRGSGKGSRELRLLRNILALADGTMDLFDLAESVGASVQECAPIIKRLLGEGLLERR